MKKSIPDLIDIFIFSFSYIIDIFKAYQLQTCLAILVTIFHRIIHQLFYILRNLASYHLHNSKTDLALFQDLMDDFIDCTDS